jgi:glycyl-tRNA synthetase alpha chain
VWCDGQEITQFTYFQQCGSFECRPVSAELTYGLERLCTYLQKVENVYELEWVKGVKYGEVFKANEVEMSHYAQKQSDADQLFKLFESYEKECRRLVVDCQLPLPAYDYALKCSHTFNLLDARGAISTTERAQFIKRVRDNARLCAEGYLKARLKLGFPLCNTKWTVGEQPPILDGKAGSEYWKTTSNWLKEEKKEAANG